MFYWRKIKIYCSGWLEAFTLAKKITTFHKLCFVKLVIFAKALEFLYAFIRMGIRPTNLNVSEIQSFQPVSFQKQGNWPKLRNKPAFQPFIKSFVPMLVCFMTYKAITYRKYIVIFWRNRYSLSRIQIRVDPHWSAPWIRIRFETSADLQHWLEAKIP
jgi:hypothetical protein